MDRAFVCLTFIETQGESVKLAHFSFNYALLSICTDQLQKLHKNNFEFVENVCWCFKPSKK